MYFIDHVCRDRNAREACATILCLRQVVRRRSAGSATSGSRQRIAFAAPTTKRARHLLGSILFGSQEQEDEMELALLPHSAFIDQHAGDASNAVLFSGDVLNDCKSLRIYGAEPLAL